MAQPLRPAILATAASAVAAPLGGAAGGLLSALVVSLVSLPFEWPTTSFDPGLVTTGAATALRWLSPTLPVLLLAIHVAFAARVPERRYGMLMGWGAFLAGGAIPYLAIPGFDLLLTGLVAGMASAWTFARVDGTLRGDVPLAGAPRMDDLRGRP